MLRLPRIEGRTAKVLVVVLLLTQLGLLLHTAEQNSETYDEPMYLLASRSYWQAGDFSFNREHPPLSKLLMGVPLALLDLQMPAEYHTDGATQLRFVYELNDDPERTVFLGRLPMILVGLLLTFYIYRFGCLFGGPKVGVLSMLASLSLPGLIGNTPLAALDLGATAFAFIALYHLARMRQEPTAGTTLIAGITFGLAQLTKFSNLLLLPIYGLLLLIDAVRTRSIRPLVRLVAILMVAFTTMFLAYGCEMRTVDSVLEHPRYSSSTPGEIFDYEPLRTVTSWFGDRPVPMLTYLKGFDQTKSKGQSGHASYYRGETRAKFMLEPGEELAGWKTFYLTVMGVKTPVGVLVALVLALLLLGAMPRAPALEGPLLLFPAMMFVFFSLATSQLGLRYILPALPGVAVLVGRLLTFDAARGRRLLAGALLVAAVVVPLGLAWEFRGERGGFDLLVIAAVVIPAAIGVALAWLVLTPTPDRAVRKGYAMAVVGLVLLGFAETLGRHPEHLMFYNPFAGGPDHGWKIVSVSDDWGQGASNLAEYQREQGLGEIWYDYYGTGIPEIYGLRYRPFDGKPVTGLVAAHAVQVTRERCKEIGRYEWMEGLEPIDRVNSILIYEVTEADLAAAEKRRAP